MKRADLAALAVIALSMVRIGATWTLYSATTDEPMHVSAGLQLYSQHAYTLQPENPPLPRLVLSLAPWLGGMKFDPAVPVQDQLLRVFYSNGTYEKNLVLARCGNLLFFLAGSLAVWWWARRELGPAGGLIATLLFALQPVVAGHAGLATHDMAATASLAVSLLAFTCWLDVPDLRRAIVFGLAFGVAVLCKFSCIGYVPAACLAMYGLRISRDRNLRAPWRSIVPAAAAAVLVVWAGYAFQVQPFVTGIRGLSVIARARTHFSFLFGEVSASGWWWYFPVAVALKTTIASLVLALASRRRGVEALAAAAAIVAVSMTSELDLGVRYVLPMYAPLSVAGAAGALALSRKWLVALLLAWHAGASVYAIPDAFPYFNEAAQPRPWRYLLDSNIDWGQDVLRLRRAVREKKIHSIGLAVSGWHDWDALGFPPHYDLHREVPSQGWIAIGEHIYGLAQRPPWLEGRRYERIGKSIRLYYVP